MKLLDTCKDGLSEALKLGADEAEVYGSSIRKVEIAIEKNDVQLTRSQREEEVGIRVFKDKGLGFASVNDFGRVKEACQNAVNLAKASPRDEYNELPEPREIKKVEKIYDPKSEEFGVEDALKCGLKMLATVRDYDPRVTIDRGSFIVEVGSKAVVNSKGIECGERSSSFTYYIFGMAVEGDKVSTFDYQFDGTRSVDEIDVERVAKEFAKNVVGSLGAGKGESFKGTVLLSPDAAQYLIVYPILFTVNANNVQKGMSKFAGKIGETIAAKELTIEDNGLLESGLGSSSFDREGAPHEPLSIIKDGKLLSYMYNTYTARKEGRSTTGHASGNARAVPGIGPTNFVLGEGNSSKDELIRGMKNGVIVTRFSGFPDPISGDFSGVAKGGYLVKDGEIVKPLLETLIAENIFDLLSKISGISQERKKVYNYLLPYARIEEVSVTAG